jgi:hypothetical protein
MKAKLTTSPSVVTKETTKKRKSTRAGKHGWKETFLASLAKTPHVSMACEAAHIGRVTAYRHKEKNKRFAVQWDEALKTALNTMEASVWKRGAYGVKRNVWMKDENGKPVKVDEIVEYDTTAAIFMLKAHDPQKYRERYVAEVVGKDEGPIAIALDPLVSAALAKVYG